MIEATRNLIEASAAPLAAALRLADDLRGRRVALVASGGNVSPEQLLDPSVSACRSRRMSDRRRALRAGPLRVPWACVILGAALAPAQAQDELWSTCRSPTATSPATPDRRRAQALPRMSRLRLADGDPRGGTAQPLGLLERADRRDGRPDGVSGHRPAYARLRLRPTGTTLGTTEFSRSDPVPMPRTAARRGRRLRALIKAAPIPGPTSSSATRPAA